MGRVCAWCSAVLRECGSSNPSVSHTICQGCLSELEETLTGLGGREAVSPPTPPASGSH